ncbi:twin-arginine translocation signal domain-containing protein [Solimonas sp. K1W22B-7]|uniref:alkaline phosphatase D family protein n=1 Tax=Solimonas sp. K1W22B-7 TaxID=2303331 RepID=UPI000E32DC54|nr:alkaline phosphatase D family protein [Solimonas sp. K1W22B-7]AXQ29541.1 twin-arginine translocation signal domain-containing protein [Solimonas sp. K1W22B-7]
MSGPRRRSTRRKSGLSRRDFLRRAGSAAAIGALPLLPGCGSSDPRADGGSGNAEFLHGVASGDPLSDRVILWTRVSGVDSSVAVSYELATDPGFANIVRRGQTSTSAARDYTVKVDADGLLPATSYYYRFRAQGQVSPAARTRTAPAGAVERLRVGVVSCSSYAHGYFNAYRKLAQRADIDVVLHLGDYIYEYGTGEYGSARPYEPDHEILTLADYRTRHAYYKREADVQAVHRQHPFITVWDDHETADNSWNGGANNHTEGAEGEWAQRKAWAIQAYHEWMPIRTPDAANPERIYRSFRYGDLAEFTMLDTRLIGRDLQASLVDAGSINDAERQLLGEPQRNFLATTLAATAGVKWKFLGQQVMFGQLRVGLPELSLLTNIPVEQLQSLLQGLPLVSTGGLVINTDQWDGYRAERQRVLDLISGLGLDNVVVLTGDIHSSWAMDISHDPNNPLVYNPLSGEGSRAVEFVCTSVTSPGLEPLNPLAPALRLLNPHMKYVDTARKGYLLLDIVPERVTGEFWYVDTIDAVSEDESFGTAFATQDGSNRLSSAGQTEPVAGAPALVA